MAYYSTVVYLIAALLLLPLAVFVGEIPNAHPNIAFLLRAWNTPTLLDWGVMSGLGLVWAGGMYFIARAYSTAQASVVAPFEYVNLPINVMWNLLLWQTFPTWITWSGAFLTIFSGMYVLCREQRLANQKRRNTLGCKSSAEPKTAKHCRHRRFYCQRRSGKVENRLA